MVLIYSLGDEMYKWSRPSQYRRVAGTRRGEARLRWRIKVCARNDRVSRTRALSHDLQNVWRLDQLSKDITALELPPASWTAATPTFTAMGEVGHRAALALNSCIGTAALDEVARIRGRRL